MQSSLHSFRFQCQCYTKTTATTTTRLQRRMDVSWTAWNASPWRSKGYWLEVMGTKCTRINFNAPSARVVTWKGVGNAFLGGLIVLSLWMVRARVWLESTNWSVDIVFTAWWWSREDRRQGLLVRFRTWPTTTEYNKYIVAVKVKSDEKLSGQSRAWDAECEYLKFRRQVIPPWLCEKLSLVSLFLSAGGFTFSWTAVVVVVFDKVISHSFYCDKNVDMTTRFNGSTLDPRQFNLLLFISTGSIIVGSIDIQQQKPPIYPFDCP